MFPYFRFYPTATMFPTTNPNISKFIPTTQLRCTTPRFTSQMFQQSNTAPHFQERENEMDIKEEIQTNNPTIPIKKRLITNSEALAIAARFENITICNTEGKPQHRLPDPEFQKDQKCPGSYFMYENVRHQYFCK